MRIFPRGVNLWKDMQMESNFKLIRILGFEHGSFVRT